MECVYDIFDFLSEEPILDQVHSLRDLSSNKYANGLKKIERFAKDKNEPERQKFLALTIKYATIMRLCDLFLMTKSAHDVEIAIQELLILGKQEKSLAKKNEFEAAAIKRDEQKKLRDYLNKKHANVSSTTEKSVVNILRPVEAHRSSVQS